ncbi:hypothetical protein WEU32_04435 [Brevundimonas sp. BH3]|uniref:hypothetical protein n=1 Tax=Brevundimonas sp. BH3 TaxID=3133089 RepID=UPI003255FC48
MFLRTLFALGLMALAGCAPLPKGPPLIGYDPAPYSDAFRAAATEAVIRSKLGEGFYDAFGDKAYTVGTSGLCAEETLQHFLSLQRGCALLGPGDNPDCGEPDLCIMLTVDSGLFKDPETRSAVEAALLRPCDALTPPLGLPYGHWPSAIGKPAAASWGLLHCGGRRQVIGSDIAVHENGAQTVIFFTFSLAKREAAPWR